MATELSPMHETGIFMWHDDEGHQAWGTAFPGGIVVVVWDVESWPPEEQLLSEHVSIYGDVGDLLQVAGGRLTWDEWGAPDVA